MCQDLIISSVCDTASTITGDDDYHFFTRSHVVFIVLGTGDCLWHCADCKMNPERQDSLCRDAQQVEGLLLGLWGHRADLF